MFIISGKWVIFYPQKQLKVGGEVLLKMYYSENCFWAKAVVAFGFIGWLLAFVKIEVGSKA
jgi:hypothetical protein